MIVVHRSGIVSPKLSCFHISPRCLCRSFIFPERQRWRWWFHSWYIRISRCGYAWNLGTRVIEHIPICRSDDNVVTLRRHRSFDDSAILQSHLAVPWSVLSIGDYHWADNRLRACRSTKATSRLGGQRKRDSHILHVTKMWESLFLMIALSFGQLL